MLTKEEEEKDVALLKWLEENNITYDELLIIIWQQIQE